MCILKYVLQTGDFYFGELKGPYFGGITPACPRLTSPVPSCRELLDKAKALAEKAEPLGPQIGAVTSTLPQLLLVVWPHVLVRKQDFGGWVRSRETASES